MFRHELELRHRREQIDRQLGHREPADSSVDIDVSSHDLTEAWREVIRRMPADLYTALRAAMPSDE